MLLIFLFKVKRIGRKGRDNKKNKVGIKKRKGERESRIKTLFKINEEEKNKRKRGINKKTICTQYLNTFSLI